MTDQRRYPFEPLRRYLVNRFKLDRLRYEGLDTLLGVKRTTIWTWQTFGMPEVTCDQVATRLGLHVSTIWPEYWDEVQVCHLCSEPVGPTEVFCAHCRAELALDLHDRRRHHSLLNRMRRYSRTHQTKGTAT